MNTPTPTLCQSLRQLSGVYRAFNDTMASQLDEAADRLESLENSNACMDDRLDEAKDAIDGLIDEIENSECQVDPVRMLKAGRVLK